MNEQGRHADRRQDVANVDPVVDRRQRLDRAGARSRAPEVLEVPALK
jgi:hypothetical protein